jgi:hypothetical protein
MLWLRLVVYREHLQVQASPKEVIPLPGISVSGGKILHSRTFKVRNRANPASS